MERRGTSMILLLENVEVLACLLRSYLLMSVVQYSIIAATRQPHSRDVGTCT